MAIRYKVVFDAVDAHRQAQFWAEVLGFRVEDNQPLIEELLEAGAVPESATVRVGERLAWAHGAGIRHPDDPFDERSDTGLGRRILFINVPEAKTVKNRLHLDVHVGTEQLEAEAARIEGLGARVVARVAEQGSTWITMADPEGNEFDLA